MFALPSSQITKPLAGALLLGASLSLTACHGTSAGADDAPQAESPRESMAPTLEWEEARRPDRATVARLPAEVVIPEHVAVEQGLPVDAVIEQWRVAAGDVVEPGDPLALLRSPALADLDADAARLQRLVSKRREVVERRGEDVESGFQTTRQLLEAEVALEEAEAELQAVRRKAAGRRGSTLKPRGSTDLWVATAAGRIAETSCAVGRIQPAGTRCLSIVSDRKAVVRVDVPQRLARRLAPSVEAAWRPFGHPEQQAGLALQMTRRAGRLSRHNHTRSYDFGPSPTDGPSTEPLTIGEAGSVTLHVPAPSNAVLVPRLAVTRMGNDQTVFIRSEGEEPVGLTVEILGEYDSDYLIRGEGLEAGLPVVSHGAFNLKSQRILK